MRILNLTDIATITPMCWLRGNLHIVQIGTYLAHPLSVEVKIAFIIIHKELK